MEETVPEGQAFAAEFEKRFNGAYAPRITAAAEPHAPGSWAERFQKYTALAVAGSLPDISWLATNVLRPFMLGGAVRELDPFVKKDWKAADLDDFYKGLFEGMRINGKQLGIPVGANCNTLFVNLNHLKEAGLPYPAEGWTREQFLDYAGKLARRDGSRWGYDMSFADTGRNATWILNNGGQPHDPKDGPLVTKLQYDDQKVIDGLQFLHDLVWKHQVAPVRNDQRGDVGSEEAFLRGRVSMYFQATQDAGNLRAKAATTGLDWDFVPLPKGPGGAGSRVGMDGYMLAKDSGDPGWTVLRELNSVEGARLRGEVHRWQPSRRSAIDAWAKTYGTKNALLARNLTDVAVPDPRAFWKDGDKVGAILTTWLQAAMIRNEIGVAAAMRQAMGEVRAYYATAP
jgi:multiple sugar transport system substrate-binding protein